MEVYSRCRLQRIYSHAAKLGQIEQALRAHGARLDDLSFGPALIEKGSTTSMVFDLYWVGDGRSRIFEGANSAPEGGRLLMRWNAVPSANRADLESQIIERWLPEASAWAAKARTRGNAWAASDHRWMLVNTHGRLTVTID
ncbi:hypothetical protein BJ980_000870 [Nocardioides daedukensis]|uniref:Uncharacterized protein n=1 Tax=Nocardioides daedukensis TaxID=634462 RepID=A0A7Y9S007_9ACTN|nr:hypothetical protein [Nocardioides daedukensis]NYG57947.1 hypothetical protein [Nocardioides daedukensis]